MNLPASGWTHEPPAETIRPATPRDVRRLLVTLVVVTVLANLAGVALLAERNPNRGNWLVAQKAALAVAGPPAETLLIGDSTCNQGLQPAGLSAALGGPVLNLCAIGTLGVVGDALLLDRYLATHPAPKRVIVSHAPDVWFRPPNVFNLGLLRPGGAEAPVLQAAGLAGPGSKLKMFAGQWLPLYAATRSLGEFIRAPRETWARVFTLDATGYMAVDFRDPDQQAKDMRNMTQTVRTLAEPLPPSTRVALQQIAERAERHGFTVYLLPSAVAAPVAAAEGFAEYTARLHAAVDAALAGNPRVKWLARGFRPFPPEEMEQADHLLVGAAERFTAEVGERVRAVEGGGGR
jgi:hypothetical protein